MKTSLWVSLFSLTLLLSATLIRAEEEAQQPFPEPGPEQKLLAQMEGEWDTKMTCHVGPTGAEPVEGSGTYTAKMDLNGFFLICDLRATLGPMPFEGRAITGYDPFKKKYVGTWADSMSPALHSIEGEWDKAGKVYTETIHGPDPTGKPITFTMITEIKNADQFTTKMMMPGEDGKETLAMKATYTRKK
jgi:hypothetical protein